MAIDYEFQEFIKSYVSDFIVSMLNQTLDTNFELTKAKSKADVLGRLVSGGMSYTSAVEMADKIIDEAYGTLFKNAVEDEDGEEIRPNVKGNVSA